MFSVIVLALVTLTTRADTKLPMMIRFPFHAASKAALGVRGVPVGPEVRAPLRGLTAVERGEVERIVRDWQG